MGSVTEVLHAFPSNTMIGAEHHYEQHRRESQQSASSRRSTLSRAPRSDTSTSSAVTIQPVHNEDITMTDVVSTSSRPTTSTRNTFHHGPRELAYHSSQSTSRDIPHQGLKSSASVHQSPVTAQSHSHAPSVSSRDVDSSSIESSIHNSPQQSAESQSPRSNPSPPSPPRIKVKSLSHIQSFVIDDASPLAFSRASSRLSLQVGRDISPQYEISEMPVAEIIEMVAGLLTKITSTNDRQQEFLSSHPAQGEGDSANMQTSSVMAFHGKNVPSISILSYLSRIHKYCPTTYEVFLSLLVYFDRMTERVNAAPYKSFRQANQESLDRQIARSQEADQSASATSTNDQQSASHHATTPPSSGSLGNAQTTSSASSAAMPPSPPNQNTPTDSQEPSSLSQFFVVDSFNIHRLVIAGVTCASKFFSDIFYTNSRYAKVGGLPLGELNNLELQFLLLNDFRLAVPLEEMEAYGTMLVEFYAREVLAQQYPSRD